MTKYYFILIIPVRGIINILRENLNLKQESNPGPLALLDQRANHCAIQIKVPKRFKISIPEKYLRWMRFSDFDVVKLVGALWMRVGFERLDRYFQCTAGLIGLWALGLCILAVDESWRILLYLLLLAAWYKFWAKYFIYAINIGMTVSTLKVIMEGPLQGRATKLLNMSRQQLSVVICLLTGHLGLSGHLHKIGKDIQGHPFEMSEK